MIAERYSHAAGRTRVVILHNEPVLPKDHPDHESEWEILETVATVEGFLSEAGYAVGRLGVCRDPGPLVQGLREFRPDVVFNLFEGLADDNSTEAHAAGLLEWMRLPYTGSPYQTLCVARDKPRTKYLLRGAGLPTADFLVVEELPVPECPLDWPVIVKPGAQDASVGVDQGSVVTDRRRLEERVAYLLETYGPPVLVEQFIRGRELCVTLVEDPQLRALPVSEIEFVAKEPDYWPIVTYDSKWRPGTRDYEVTPPRYPATVTPRLAERLTTVAKQAFRLLGCRDYARVDFRVRAGKPYVLEVNPNPDFSPTAGLIGALVSAGLSHADFAVALVERALARAPVPRAANHFPAGSV
jgi:D-alanine-D-alanine ligase